MSRPGFMLAHGLVVVTALLTACGYTDFRLPEPARPREPGSFTVLSEPGPVLGRGSPGEWDAVDVLNPSVVLYGGVYYNIYSGFDGAMWHTGLATSSDGLHWQKQGKVLSPDPSTWEGGYIAANGSALWSAGEFLYWFQAGPKGFPRIGLARSADGRHWVKEKAPVLETGPRGSWDERGVADPCVVRIGPSFYMYYLGQDRARRQQLGVARSADGLRWQKLRSNPILTVGLPGSGSGDEHGLGEPAVWPAHGYYWMLYTGRSSSEMRTLRLARSQDGIHWEKTPSFFSRHEQWNRAVLCDATVLAEPAVTRVWFGGGDVAAPDENIHGQIGAGTLHFSQAS